MPFGCTGIRRTRAGVHRVDEKSQIEGLQRSPPFSSTANTAAVLPVRIDPRLQTAWHDHIVRGAFCPQSHGDRLLTRMTATSNRFGRFSTCATPTRRADVFAHARLSMDCATHNRPAFAAVLQCVHAIRRTSAIVIRQRCASWLHLAEVWFSPTRRRSRSGVAITAASAGLIHAVQA